MCSVKRRVVSLLVLAGIIFQVEGTIRVISILDDETVFVIQARPILTNIDGPSKGMLVVAKPSNACKPIAPAPPMPINMTLHVPETNSSSNGDDLSWALLVSWNNMEECSISTKADNALSGGFNVIIFEDPAPLEDMEPEGMSPLLTPVVTSPAYEYGWTDASVYAYTVDPEDWKILKHNFTSDEYFITFDDPHSMTSWFTYFLLGVLIIGAVFFTIGLSYVLVQLTGLLLIWIRESIVSRLQQIRRERRRRLPASQLKKIPIQQWNSDMLQDICSICLESFVESDRVRILPCSHVFHQACIDPWLLKQRRKCPNCKRKIVFPEENRDSDSSSDDERTPLIRRNSSSRESPTISPQHSRHHHFHHHHHHHPHGGDPHRVSDEYYHPEINPVVVMGNSENPSGRNEHDCPFSQSMCQHCCSFHSSLNTSTEAPSASDNDTTVVVQSGDEQSDLKGRVEQLCSRMENVGRKIQKKVKANQSSKLDNDSSSDMSTAIQPVLVSVTVESNNLPDSDEKDCHEGSESQYEEMPSTCNTNNSSNANACIPDSSQAQGPSNSQLSPELKVKVVPDSANQSVNSANAESTNNLRRDSSISADLNA